MIWLIVLPLVWASLAFVLGPGRGQWIAKWLAIAGLAAQAELAFNLAQAVGVGGTVLAHSIGGWGAPLGIDLAADGLSAAMLLLTQCVALPLAIYASAYYKRDDAAGAYFWPLAGFLIAGLNALFLSADLFNIYVTLELVGLAAVGLVAAGGGAQQVAAALRYLFATLLGSGLYLLGVALIYGAYGTVSISVLTPLVTSEAPRLMWLAGALMMVGLMLKTALFPFHYWLPPAHGGAPAPVSALLSALVVKASFYLILRLWTGPFAPLVAAAEWLAWLPATLGSLAIFWGSWRAIRAERLKMLIAYSTVAQLGYLFLIFPLLSGPGAIQAGVMQAFAHGFAKAAMFVAAGVFIKATGQESVAGLVGAVERLPVTLFAFGLAGMTLMGLPPSSGFLAKWQLIEAALAQGFWPLVVVVLAGGLLASVYVFRVLRQAFLLAPSDQTLVAVPRTLEWTAFALAAASVLLGLRGVELMQLLGVVA
ncbi:proton-conducting transporter membrane subunit [Rhodoferax sp.]|uniref:complex I subunit 5 family protein n=1 Tax=Rhodoferax sp. TaxID=50421 RepID=UPI0019FA0227|nr:proton-conducting transporter membrane subunit [Rhodoferax sp.]MBE0473208.1 oxidoreductase [Rhodoferax sp.]